MSALEARHNNRPYTSRSRIVESVHSMQERFVRSVFDEGGLDSGNPEYTLDHRRYPVEKCSLSLLKGRLLTESA